MNRKNTKTISENETEHSFESAQEKKDYINQVWDKVREKENICDMVKKVCLIVCFAVSLILLFVFEDSLPKSLTEVRGVGRRRNIPLLTFGSILGLIVGELLSRILIKLLKLEE